MFSTVQPGVAPQARVSNVHKQAASSPARTAFGSITTLDLIQLGGNKGKLHDISIYDLVLNVFKNSKSFFQGVVKSITPHLT